MRAMRLHAQAPIETAPLQADAIEPPAPAADELLVGISACGVCRTDLHVIEGDLPLRRAPITPGHQAVGRVARAGPAVTRFAIGDRVGIAWLRRTCGGCAYCRSGRENLCDRPEFTGYTHDGGYAEYALVPEAFAYRIPPAVGDADAAPLLCAGIIGYRALTLAAVPPGGRLGLWGFGSSAHVTLQLARARGIDVYVATREASHRAHARELGAAWAGALGEPIPVRVDGGILFAPVGELVPDALRALDRGGTLALAGIYMSRLPAMDHGLLFEERILRSVTANTRADGEALLSEAARIPIRPTVTTFPLVEANRALGLLKRGAIAGTGVLLTAAAGSGDPPPRAHQPPPA
jgi:propanol-preferring alcohol dehydrogenase